MRLKETVGGTPIYLCNTPAVKYEYRETWHGRLCDEISLFLQGLREGILLRGSHAKNLDMVAKTGSDYPRAGKGSLTYVVPYQDVISIYYPFDKADPGLLVYKSSGLVELTGDAENMNVDSNRYQFIVHPKEALLGIIDLSEVKQELKRLRSLDREMSRALDTHNQYKKLSSKSYSPD